MLKPIVSASLSWMGITGGAITVFSNLETLFKLADWARWLVDTWRHWLTLVWDLFLVRFPFDLTSDTRFQMTMAFMIICMAVGARLSTTQEDFDRDEWSPGAHNIFRSNVIVAVVIFALHSWFFGYYVRHIDQAFLASWPWLFGSLTFYGVYAVAIFIGLCHWPFFAAITGTVGALIFSEAFQSAAMAVHSSSRAHEMMSLVIGTGFRFLLASWCYIWRRLVCLQNACGSW